ncbi:hypothetical protein TNCV_4438811 [Trichonephila clavipes]|nr:hypothetical protein TNCV_4438811 [Trichonephila clavipes]
MPNSPSQMIPDMLDWRKIWGLGRPRKGSNSLMTPLPCEAKHCLVEKMAPGSRCMSDNACGYRMSWTCHWTAMWSHGSILGVTVYCRE